MVKNTKLTRENVDPKSTNKQKPRKKKEPNLSTSQRESRVVDISERETRMGKETDLAPELRAGEEEARQRNLGDLKVEIGGRAEEGNL